MPTLDAIPVGQHVRIIGFRQQAQGFRHKLLAMGLTPGVMIKIIRLAPLGDPIQVMLRGYTLSLRKKECQQIEVEYANGNTQQDKPSARGLLNTCAGREP